jgi:transposase
MRPQGTPVELGQRRQLALVLLTAGETPAEISRLLDCTQTSVARWRDTAATAGAAGLAPTPAPGRPRKLSVRQEQRLLTLLTRGAEAEGFGTNLWTQQRVRHVILERFGVAYHHDSIGRLLHRLGWSAQRPERRALERDEAAIAAWRRHTWPRVKKKRRG